MADWFEYRFDDVLILVIMFGGFGWLIATPYIFPPAYASAIGMGGYVAITFIGIFGIDIGIRETINKYNYIEAIKRPDNKKYHFFVDSAVKRKITENLNSALIRLAFPVKMGDYGKVKQVIINYYGDWNKRLNFDRGHATYMGYTVVHPQTEYIEISQDETMSTQIERGEPVPVFFLQTASRDCLMPKISIPIEAYYSGNKSSGSTPNSMTQKQIAELITLKENITQLNKDNMELRRQLGKWHQNSLALENINEQKSAETKGLLQAKSGVNDMAIEYLLTLIQATGSFDKARKVMLGGSVLTFNKFMMYAVITFGIIAYLWFNPEVANGIFTWLNNPMNSGVALIIVAIVGFIIYWKYKK